MAWGMSCVCSGTAQTLFTAYIHVHALNIRNSEDAMQNLIFYCSLAYIIPDSLKHTCRVANDRTEIYRTKKNVRMETDICTCECVFMLPMSTNYL